MDRHRTWSSAAASTSTPATWKPSCAVDVADVAVIGVPRQAVKMR
jgi:hypothetical protein